jgi:hypothetical protein
MDTEWQLFSNDIDHSVVKKEESELEVSNYLVGVQTCVKESSDSSSLQTINSLNNGKGNAEEINCKLKNEYQCVQKTEMSGIPVPPVLSKSALKKLKKKELWEQRKKERRCF